MKISIDQIKDKPLLLQAEEPVESFPLLMTMQDEAACRFTSPVRYDLTVAREFDHLRVAGKIGVTVELTCSRCLAAFEKPLSSALTIIYRRGTPDEIPLEEETELSVQDLVSTVYSGDELDLGHEIAEQIAIEVPFRPLCDEACKGLCPDCGTDLNRSSCSCPDRNFNFKFSALKDFKVSR